MEARVAGTVPESSSEDLIELLVGLSGQRPAEVEVHETVLRCASRDRRDLYVTHLRAGDAERFARSALLCSVSLLLGLRFV
jgi:hypothetical protein